MPKFESLQPNLQSFLDWLNGENTQYFLAYPDNMPQKKKLNSHDSNPLFLSGSKYQWISKFYLDVINLINYFTCLQEQFCLLPGKK
ncbi:hypothetical protein [Legionella jordanis]|uniref:Uncharacterized protein n=1 Tax=Legionella jordanis TaxID=456 RepID=A0A0W0V8M9_9GAMM|nr:hypothetical protein [Legionella jordanis]KTD16460.1 hypothetical protein Ljor_0766 [Legionella jordanis]RMX03990.1 hypothetical protein EAW55_06455 [Legionella jordanis]VEH12080.1 Uncharacterised protein [Legionella jordanis]HAT8712619.1 hypothetical protein [Legionella jordanis]